jgi:muramoyltetrapeptide carboxypeptidase
MRRAPKIFAGYSDATFLHLGFARIAGVRTLHGPNLHGLALGRAVEIRRWLAWLSEPTPALSTRSFAAPRRIGGPRRSVRGRVFGGNLALVHYAAGTRFMPAFRGAILFLEEVNEPPYKIDGMLAHLALSGTLRGIRGVALGSFVKCVARRGQSGLSLETVVRDHLVAAGAPVVAGLRAGHGKRNLPLPFGARAILDARHGRLVFEEGLVC